jgi:hypothetical protein
MVDAGPGGGLAAGQGVDAEHEFGEVEGFGQVVVGAEAEAADAVVAGAGGLAATLPGDQAHART